MCALLILKNEILAEKQKFSRKAAKPRRLRKEKQKKKLCVSFASLPRRGGMRFVFWVPAHWGWIWQHK
jgi:hypothetical protein